MSRVANAAENVVNTFKSRVYSVGTGFNEFKSSFVSASGQIISQCEHKIYVYNTMALQADELVRKAQAKQSAAQANAQASSAQAASTPKTIKVTATDSNGNSVTKEKSNPAYAAAQASAKNAQAQANAADNALKNAQNLKKQISAKLENLYSLKRQVERLSGETATAAGRASSSVDSAISGLARVLAALSDYMSYDV